MRNKTNAVIIHLKEKGSITSLEAIKLYGATRLSAIIYVLRHNYGMNIISEKQVMTDRFGSTCPYAKYILVGDDND